MWENVINCTHHIIWLFPFSYFANSSSQILKLIINYFGLIISQIRVRKCVIIRMPINNADIPIADNEPEIKIDNLVERAYLYRAQSDTVPNYNKRFYKYKQKFNGLDTFISEDGIYYIWAKRVAGNTGQWVVSKKIGDDSGGTSDRVSQNANSNFFTTKVPVEGNYTNFITVIVSKITSDTR